MKLSVSVIRLDGGTQSRAGLDNTLINEYCEAMKEGAEFPPVVVFHDGKDYWLSDGFHRVFAAINAGFTEIDADIRKGAIRDAKLFSMSANARHGKRRSNADKRHAVLMALEDEQWRDLPNTKIAEMCEVTEFLVRKIRDEQTTQNSIKSNPDQPSPNLNQDELLALKIRADEAEKRAENLKNEAEAKVKARLDAMREEYQRRFDEAVAKVKAASKPAEIDKLVEQRTAEKVAELERARRETDAERVSFEREHEKKLAALNESDERREKMFNERLGRKLKEIDEAAKAGLDLTKLKNEMEDLRIESSQLKREIDEERESLNVRAKMKKVLSAVTPAITLSSIVNETVSDSPNYCGLSAEDMEAYVSEIDRIILYSQITKKAFQGFICSTPTKIFALARHISERSSRLMAARKRRSRRTTEAAKELPIGSWAMTQPRQSTRKMSWHCITNTGTPRS